MIISKKNEIAQLYYTAFTLRKQGHIEKAENVLTRLEEIIDPEEDLEAFFSFFKEKAMIEVQKGNYELALNYINRTMSFAEDKKNFTVLGMAYIAKGEILDTQGQYWEAIVSYNEAILNYEKIFPTPDFYAIANILINKGEVQRKIGNNEEAYSYYKQALDLLLRCFQPRPNFIGTIAIAYNNCGLTLLAMNKEERAEVNFQQAIQYCTERFMQPQAYIESNLGLFSIYFNKKDIAKARACLINAQFYSYPDIHYRIWCILHEAELYQAEENIGTARLALEKALSAADRLNLFEVKIKTLLRLANLSLLSFRLTEVQRYFTEAHNYLDMALKEAINKKLISLEIDIHRIRGKLFIAAFEFRQAQKEIESALTITKEQKFTHYEKNLENLLEEIQTLATTAHAKSEDISNQPLSLDDVVNYLQDAAKFIGARDT